MVVLLIVGFAVASLGKLLTGLAWAVAVAFVLQTVRGLGIATMDVAHVTMLQRLVPDQMLGRVFGNLYGAIAVAAAVSYLGGGLLLDSTGASTTFVVAGVAGWVAMLVVALTLRGALRDRSTGEPWPHGGRGVASSQRAGRSARPGCTFLRLEALPTTQLRGPGRRSCGRCSHRGGGGG